MEGSSGDRGQTGNCRREGGAAQGRGLAARPPAEQLKPAFTRGARARAEDGGGALRALETLQRRLDEFDAQAARLSLGGAGA